MSNLAGLLEQAAHRKTVLYQRMKEAKRAAAETTDPAERHQQTERVRILRDMYMDACDEVARLGGKPRAERKTQVHGDFIFGSSEVWSDLEGMTWNAVDGAAWGDILAARDPGAATGRQSKLLVDLLNDSIQSCTDRQKVMIHEYYTLEKPMQQIAEEQNINKSTVSRIVRHGLAHVAHHVVARLTIASCIEDDGQFDYLKFCRSAKILTERQTELLYLALTQDASYTMMAAYIGRHLSTVCRIVDRMKARLSAVRVELLPEIDVSKVRFKDWAHIDEVALASKLGLSRKFYYTTIRGREKIYGIPPLHYHGLYRMRADCWTPQQTAVELGTSVPFCTGVLRRYAGVDIPLDRTMLSDYQPAKVERCVQPGSVLASLRDLTRGSDSIIDRIDGATLARLQGVVQC